MTSFGSKVSFPFDTKYNNVYIHVPFCRCKCGYCAFYSVSGEKATRYMQELWLERVAAELGRYKYTTPLDTLYFGGGTPTFLESDLLGKLRDVCCRILPLDDNTEISMETNPETLNEEKLSILKGFVNRLSVGIQGFDPDRRELLGRDCSDEQIRYALTRGRELFPHLNADLIYALPTDEEDIWKKELENACNAGCDHISCYEITPEKEAWRKFPAPPQDLSMRLWQLTADFLAAKGIYRYEVSNYARKGCECRHNDNVWTGQLLCGIGPGASGFNGKSRWLEKADIDLWLAHTKPEIDDISSDHRAAEILTIGLRRTAGWTKAAAKEKFPQKLLDQMDRLKMIVADFWVQDPDVYALSERGLAMWDGIAALLLEVSLEK